MCPHQCVLVDFIQAALQASKAAMNEAKHCSLNDIWFSSCCIVAFFFNICNDCTNELYHCNNECSQSNRSQMEATRASAGIRDRGMGQLAWLFAYHALLIGILWTEIPVGNGAGHHLSNQQKSKEREKERERNRERQRQRVRHTSELGGRVRCILLSQCWWCAAYLCAKKKKVEPCK